MMMNNEFSYCYDKSLKNWKRGSNWLLAPMFSEIKTATRSVWCRRHHRWEDIAMRKGDNIVTRNSCVVEGPFVARGAYFPYAFVLKFRQDIGLVTLFIHVENYNNGAMKSFVGKVTFSMNKGICDTNSFSSVKIPKVVMDDIIQNMGIIFKSKTGITPTPTTKIQTVESLQAFVEFPFNNNFHFLKCIEGFPLQTIDRFDPNSVNKMYDMMGIKPFKTLRKKYQEEPFAPVVVKILQQVGFTDLNIIFNLLNEDFIYYLKCHDLRFDRILKTFSFYGYDDFEFFCKENLKFNKEKVVINALKKTLEKNIHRRFVISDGLRMFRRNYDAIQPEDKDRIFHDGLDEYIHNNLIKLNKNNSGYYVPFNNTEQVKQLEWNDEARGYTYCLPENPDTLMQIGGQMNNCVGCYGDLVKNGDSIIVAAKKDDKWRICIELSPRFEVRQALGPCNKELDGDALDSFNEWAKRNNIDTSCSSASDFFAFDPDAFTIPGFEGGNDVFHADGEPDFYDGLAIPDLDFPPLVCA